MKTAAGFKAHSGWAALVLIGIEDGLPLVLDRRRIGLVDAGEPWAKAPYHAAEPLPREEALALVARGVEAARRAAQQEMQALLARHPRLSACGVIVGAPMPAWTTEQILAVHPRMHKAEGHLFYDALSRAARSCGLALTETTEKGIPPEALAAAGPLGKQVGPPWGRDQKLAAFAALEALKGIR